MAENVAGLKTHDKGRTLKTMINVFSNLGYTIIEPKILKAIYYNVPQKRQRIFIIGIRNDLYTEGVFERPSENQKILTLKDALKA